MKAKWQQLKQKYEQFETRERLLILGAFIALVFLLWDFILVQPVKTADKILLAKERNAKQSITTTQAEVTVLSGVAKRDPSVVLKNEIALLQSELQQMDAELTALSAGLIPAQQLPSMLHDVLKSNKKLKLMELRTIPSERVILSALEEEEQNDSQLQSASNDAPEQISAAELILYRHGVSLSFAGSYIDSSEYLQALEKGQWKFYWDRFSYEVKSHPIAEVALTVYTLSTEKGVFDGQK